MTTKFYNLDIDTTLGNNSPSDSIVSSQKAIKTYIDNNINAPRNIGEIIQSTIPLTDAGLHLLDGSKLLYASYKDFIDYIATLYNSGNYPNIFETEANWQTSVTNYGVCGKFVYDNVNNTVRLPKITGFTESTIAPTELGDLIQAGLPNITGKFGVVGSNGNTGWASNMARQSGAFYQIEVTAGTQSFASVITNTNSGTNDTGIDASRSSSIYGNSNTVQPQSIKVLYYIVIATTTKTEIEVDIDEIATDLNGKADADLANVNDNGKISASTWGFPVSGSDKRVSLTLGASGTTYTAPATGWIFLQKKATGEQYLRLNNTSAGIAIDQLVVRAGQVLSAYLPVKKGDTYLIQYNAGGATDYFHFVYAVGSESEAS